MTGEGIARGQIADAIPLLAPKPQTRSDVGVEAGLVDCVHRLEASHDVDRLRHVATANDRRLDLTPKEFQLLEYFLLHSEEVVRRTTLLEKVWDMHFDPESNVVDVHVGNLRRKLTQAAGESLLTTVRGVGFSLRRGKDASEVSQVS